MIHQGSVSRPLLEPFSGRETLFVQMPRAESEADHSVAVNADRTPCRLEGVKMATAMLFPGGVAVEPLEAEEAVLYPDATVAL